MSDSHEVPQRVLDTLCEETCLRSIQWLPEAASTNTLALRQAAEVAAGQLPRLFWADRQTAGRGRGTNAWWASEGSLTFSVLLAPGDWGLPPALWPQISLATGIAVCEALDAEFPGLRVGVKWPNDVFCGGRKLGGILLEPSDRCPDRLVVGIGLNVNNSLGEAPEEIRRLATSLVDEVGKPTPRERVLARVLQRLEATCGRLAAGRVDWPGEWSRHCVLTGRRIKVTAGERIVEGICAGIDDSGALKVGTQGGMERCLGGTVRLLPGPAEREL